MIFPFKIKYKSQLANKVKDELYENEIIRKIRSELNRHGISDVKVSERRIDFTNNFANQLFNWQLFLPVDSGSFSLDLINRKINYEIEIIKLPIFTTIIFSVIAIVTKTWWVVPLGVSLFYGVNFFIAIIRHQMFLDRLVTYLK